MASRINRLIWFTLMVCALSAGGVFPEAAAIASTGAEQSTCDFTGLWTGTSLKRLIVSRDGEQLNGESGNTYFRGSVRDGAWTGYWWTNPGTEPEPFSMIITDAGTRCRRLHYTMRYGNTTAEGTMRRACDYVGHWTGTHLKELIVSRNGEQLNGESGNTYFRGSVRDGAWTGFWWTNPGTEPEPFSMTITDAGTRCRRLHYTMRYGNTTAEGILRRR